MPKILYFFLLVFPVESMLSAPPTSKPVLIIDCGKNQGVFQDSCFKMIQFATNRLSDSGKFSNIRSISNQSFLYRNSNQVFTVTLSESSNFRTYSTRNYLLAQYQSEMSILCDKNFRYSIIYVATIPEGSISCPECIEISDTLGYSKIKSLFYYDDTFTDMIHARLGLNSLRIKLEFVKSLPVDNIGIFYRLNSLQNKMYSLSGIKTVYSAINIYSFISSVIFTNPAQITPELKWSGVVKAWDLGGERRSAYLDFSSNSLYMDIFISGKNSRQLENILTILSGFSTDVVTDWVVTDNQDKIVAKKDDTVKKENRVALDEQSITPNTIRK